MKKWLCFVLTVLLLSGCASDSGGQSEVNQPPTTLPPVTQPQQTQPPTEETTIPPTTEALRESFDMSLIPDDGTIPAEEIPHDYNRETAVQSGAVIIEEDVVCANGDRWEDFLTYVEAGEPAHVRVITYSLERMNVLRDIYFDGLYFRTRSPVYYIGGELSEVWEYDYLYQQSFGGNHQYEDGTIYGSYVQYYLTREWLKRKPAWADYPFEAEEGGQLVYCHTELDVEMVNLPENLTAAKLMLEEKVLGEVQGTEQLESLRKLLAASQRKSAGLPSWVSSWQYQDLVVILTGEDGTEFRIEIAMEQDFMCLDGKFYDYGPGMIMGRDGEPRYYNAILDLVRHFGLEDWPEAVREYCLKRGWEPPMHSLAVIVGEEEHG